MDQAGTPELATVLASVCSYMAAGRPIGTIGTRPTDCLHYWRVCPITGPLFLPYSPNGALNLYAYQTQDGGIDEGADGYNLGNYLRY